MRFRSESVSLKIEMTVPALNSCEHIAGAWFQLIKENKNNDTVFMKSLGASGSRNRIGSHPYKSEDSGSAELTSLLNSLSIVTILIVKLPRDGVNKTCFLGPGNISEVLSNCSGVWGAAPVPVRMRRAFEACPFLTASAAALTVAS